MSGDSSPLLPQICRVREIISETSVVKRLRLETKDQQLPFSAAPGQFAMISLLGVGEAPFSICGGSEKWLEFAVKEAGLLTEALHELDVGDMVGLRGPYGNGFPVEQAKGRDLLFVGGGIGLAVLRSFINYALNEPADFGRINILYGARSQEDIVFKQDLYELWPQNPQAKVRLTVDEDGPKWQGRVGQVTSCLLEVDIAPENCLAVLCGPQPMLDSCLRILAELGFRDEQILLALERRMHCALGQCGHCNIGGHYVCLEGPIFTKAQLSALPGQGVGS